MQFCQLKIGVFVLYCFEEKERERDKEKEGEKYKERVRVFPEGGNERNKKSFRHPASLVNIFSFKRNENGGEV